MILRWFISKTVREAAAARKHVFHILCAQRDLLTGFLRKQEGINPPAPRAAPSAISIAKESAVIP